MVSDTLRRIVKTYILDKSTMWKRLIKCAVAYEIATIMLLIHPVLDAFGNVPYLLILATLFFNPAGTIGFQIVEIFLNMMYLVPTAIFIAIIQYCLALYNSALARGVPLYSNGAGIIAAVSYFVCVYGIAFTRVKYPRLFQAAMQGMPLPFFCLTRDIYSTEFNVLVPAGIVYPMAIGGCITLLVNMCLWPETAIKASEVSLGKSLTALRSVLEFMMDNETAITTSEHLKGLVGSLQGAVDGLRKAQREAKYEVAIARYPPLAYKPISHTLDRLADHMYGMQLALERTSQIMLNPPTSFSNNEALNDDVEEDEELTVVTRLEFKHLTRVHDAIQPAMRTFMSHCVDMLGRIQNSLASNRAIPRSMSVEKPGEELQEHVAVEDALKTLQEHCDLAMQYEYRHTRPAEEHFLVYTIMYTLVESGQELVNLEQQVNDLLSNKKSGKWRIFFPKMALRKWLSRTSESEKGVRTADEDVVFAKDRMDEKEKRMEQEEGDETHFVPLHNAPGKHFYNRILYRVVSFLQSPPARYALKFSLACELLALMAWIPVPGLSDFYTNNHGQWAMLSAMTVSNYTIGLTIQSCIFRVVATAIGGVCGYLTALASHRNEDPYVFAVLIGIFQIPMWYTLFNSRTYARLGFISLLTMAVISSTDYTNFYHETLVSSLWKRIVTAAAAAVVLMVVDQLFWPVWARKLLLENFAKLLTDTGIQYAKVTSAFSQQNTASPRYIATKESIKFHAHVLRSQFDGTSQMLTLSGPEPRLTKAPFPLQEYRKLLELEKRMLYWIRHMAQAESKITPRVRELRAPVAELRKEMAGNVHLYMFTLGSCIRARCALPAMMPSAEAARQVLQKRHIESWQEMYQVFRQQEPEKTETLMYWHTCAAAAVEIICLSEAMGDVVSRLMGQYIFPGAATSQLNKKIT